MTPETPDLFQDVERLAARLLPAPRPRRSARTVRVLHVIRAGRGREAKHLRLLLKHLDRETFEPTVVASGLEAPAYLDTLRAMDVPVIDLPMHASLNAPEDLAAMQFLMALLRRGHFDVMHLHGHKAALVGRPAARITSTRSVVYTPHGFDFLRSHSPRARQLALRVERTLGRFTHAMICASREEADVARRLRLVPAARVHTVPDGVDFDELPQHVDNVEVRRTLGISCATRLITMTGKLEAPKDPGTLLRASRHVLVPSPWNHIVLVGDGNLIPFCRDLARQLDVGRQVICTGYRADATAISSTSAIHILSAHDGGPTLSLLEGMAQGKPLIASDTPGIREVVSHGKTGVLVPAADERFLSGALLKLIEDEDLARRLGEAAQAYVRQHHPIDRWIRGIETVTLKTLRRRRRRR